MKKEGLLYNSKSVVVPPQIYEGEHYFTILRYFFPEFITTLVVYTMPFWIDAAFIGSLKSVETYTTLGITNNFIHTLIKIAEALSVGMVILSGKHNGKNEFTEAGKALVDAFWLTTIMGISFSLFLYFGAPAIYRFYNVSPEIMTIGIPFLRIRSIGVFCMFIYFALVGFLRGIKDTKTPMKIFLVGSALFITFDYLLIFGKYGFPALGLQGSGIATCIQYASMMFFSLWYIMTHEEVRKYSIELLKPFTDFSYAWHLIKLTIPVVFDKTAMAFAYVWLGKMMNVIGSNSAAAFCIVRDMERFAFIPALAFAQVITFLTSNDVGRARWFSVKNNIKKVIFLASAMVAFLLITFSRYAFSIASFFDKTGTISVIAAQAFPLLSIFVFFDLLQLILSGALRGAGNVYVVMIVRLAVGLLFFGPFSYFFVNYVHIEEFYKFIALYSIFYISNAFMTIAYLYWFNGDEWKNTQI